jgi:hypothetical protein
MRNFIFVLTLVLISTTANAGLSKWFRTEFHPTLSGDRPLKIDPNRITISHKGKTYFELRQDAVEIHIGDITLQTSQLRKRLAQAGCIYASGNPFKCAPDILEREINNLTSGKYKEELEQYPELYYELAKNYQAQYIPPTGCTVRRLYVSHVTCLNLANGWQKIELSRPANQVALRHEFKIVIPTMEEIEEMQQLPTDGSLSFGRPNSIVIPIPQTTLTRDITPYQKEFPHDTILIYVPSLGVSNRHGFTSSISTVKDSVTLPYPVEVLFMRINTRSTFNNKGVAAIVFTMENGAN